MNQALGESAAATKGWRFEFQLSGQANGFLLRFSAKKDTERAERSIQVETCEEALRAATLMTVLTVSPERAEAMSEPSAPAEDVETRESGSDRETESAPSTRDQEKKPDVETSEPPFEAPDEPTVADDAPPSEKALGPSFPWAIHAGASLDTSLLPGPSFGPRVGVEFSLERFVFGVSAGYFYMPPKTDGEVRLQFGAGSAGLSAAWLAGPELVRFGPEIFGEFFLVHAKAAGTATPDLAITYTGNVGAGPRLQARLSPRLDGVLQGYAIAPTSRPVFSVSEVGQVHEIAPISFRIQAGLGYRF